MSRLRYVCCVLLLGICLSLPAQAQLDWEADTVQIQAQSLRALTPGHRRIGIDSLQLRQSAGQSLAEVLAQHTDVFIKSYGQGSLASTSLRGGGAAHTALLWNGIPLQSPMNGQADFSLTPAFLLDEVVVQYGGSASLYGSGAVGGAIHLNNETPFGKGTAVRANLQLGSLGLWQPGLDIQLSRKQWLSRTRVFYQQAQNDFRLPDGRAQPHAALQQQGVLQEAALRLSPRQSLRLWVWGQHTERELPPPFTNLTGEADQTDSHLRIAAQWQYKDAKWHSQFRSAYLREYLYYGDSSAAIFSHNLSHTWLQEAEATHFVSPRHQLRLALQHQHQQARADGYNDQLFQQSQLAAVGSFRWLSPFRRWETIASLRQAWLPSEQQPIPLLPSLSLRGRLLPWLQVRGQAGRTFRLPTFNDRYWQPGGNPDLRSETGWHQEMGLQGQWKIGTQQVHAHFTAFHQLIDDWILWRPGPTYWYPENLRKVRSQGLESEIRWENKRAAWQWDLTVAHTYTQAQIQRTDLPRDASLGKQLIYTPRQQARFAANAQWKAFRLGYLHRWTGRRYTSSDNAFFLPAYDTGRIYLAWSHGFPRWTGSFSARLDNVWGETYQVISNRPMPRRILGIGLDIHFLSKKSLPISS